MLTSFPGGPVKPTGPGDPIGTSPYSGHVLAHFLITLFAKVDICSKAILLHTSITRVSGKGSPYIKKIVRTI